MKAVGGQKAFKLEGVPELVKTLRAIRKTLNAEGNVALAEKVRDTLLVPAKMIADDAGDLAPVKTGNLRRSIKAVPGKGASAVAYVDLKQAPYALFVERGTSKMPAQSFFRPAVAATRPVTARVIAERLPDIIAEAAAREAWQKGSPK